MHVAEEVVSQEWVVHEALQNHVHEAGLAEIQKSASTCAACVSGFVFDGTIVITFTDNRG